MHPTIVSTTFRMYPIASDQTLLQHITMSLLRTHAYSLLQYHPIIVSTPKTYLCTGCWQPKFSLLASQTCHHFCDGGVLGFQRSARDASLL
ncbi:hypothetical protein BDR03DRAFT_965208 [Suillus americanus]|nr:hypothetical protein BDR03DRAFT_965208 [Suillus americanus]